MKLNYKTFGEGQPLIILHGLFGTLDNWQTLARKFAEHFRVFIVDQRNHGKSPHNDFIDYPSMADDLYDFLSDHDLQQVIVLGHSMGGKTAMQFAHTYPEKVNRLIVVDIAPKAYPPGHHFIFDALFSIDLDTIESRSDAEAVMEEKIGDEAIRLFLLKNLTRTKAGGYRWKMNLDAIYRHYEDILSAVRSETPFANPTLFIRGERSNYIQDEDFSSIHEQFSTAEIVTMPGAGHWLHSEQPEEMLKIVLDFSKAER